MQSATAHKSFEEIISGNKPVLVGFYSDWSSSWEMVKPLLDEASKKWGDQLITLKIDVVRNPKIVRQFQIHGVPTLVLFKNNTVCWKQAGVVTYTTLNPIIQQNL